MPDVFVVAKHEELARVNSFDDAMAAVEQRGTVLAWKRTSERGQADFRCAGFMDVGEG